jgi:hypothetical protein
MNESSLRNALLAAEPPSPELERRYRERLRDLTERRLTWSLRAAHGVGLLIALGTAIRCVFVFTQVVGHVAPVALAALALAFVFSAGWVVATTLALVSGADRVFGNSAVRAWLIVGFAFLLAALMLWAGITAGDAAQGVRFMFFGLTFWCATGLPFLVFQLVSEMQARLRTDVLRLELTFAERAAARGERS